jgi:RNA polymerase sigma-70 factor (ECF subfamily)
LPPATEPFLFLKKDEETTRFEKVYLAYFQKMKHFAGTCILSEEEAENIVQDVFTELWEKRETRFGYANLESYLFVSVKNRCLNFLRHRTVVQESTGLIQEEYLLKLKAGLNSLEALDLDFLSERNVDDTLKKALNDLPEKCRRIFVMSKIEGKKQKEIAAALNLSINTVETQMGIAYRHLRHRLKDFLPLLLLFLLSP